MAVQDGASTQEMVGMYVGVGMCTVEGGLDYMGFALSTQQVQNEAAENYSSRFQETGQLSMFVEVHWNAWLLSLRLFLRATRLSG